MDDERRTRALARGLFVLVGPAPVIAHALAAEQGFVAGVEARVVDEHHHRLALHVEAGVVVPVRFGRVHAVADEHHLAVLELHLGLTGARADHHVGAEGELARRATQRDLAHRGRIGRGFHHRHGLEIAVAIAGLEPESFELRFQVIDGEFLASATRGAAFELVRGQHLHVLGEILGRDFRAEAVRRRRRGLGHRRRDGVGGRHRGFLLRAGHQQPARQGNRQHGGVFRQAHRAVPCFGEPRL